VKIEYAEARRRAWKERDIWTRKLICDPITTPIAYLLARTGWIRPRDVTILTFALGVVAAWAFATGGLVTGAVLYFFCFLSDSLDGKLNRVLGQDDTRRGIADFILDGIVCVAVAVSIGLRGDLVLRWLLLAWMSIHYLDMRYTSATYRLKVQFGDSSVWIINERNRGWVLRTYGKFVRRTGTYPHPTVGEAVMLMFVVGPILWQTVHIDWMHIMAILGILCIVPETIGAGIVAYSLARKEGD